MTYQTFTEFNATGLEGFLTYPAEIVPIFIPLILLGFFLIILSATYFSKRRLTGTGDFPSSFATASYVTTILSMIMMLIPNLINTLVVVVCVVISAIATLMLFLSKD